MKLKPPKNAYEVRSFLGMVNYYRDIWPRRTHMLSSFSALSHGPRNKKVEWTEELDVAFNQLKASLARMH